MVFSPPPSEERLWFSYVPLALGIVLLAAAGLKAYGFIFDPISTDSFFVSPRLLITVIQIEMLLGLWLLSGLAPRPARFAALGFFGLLGCVSFSLAWHEQRSCGCLGPLAVKPWFVFSFDVLAIVALWKCDPLEAPRLPWASPRNLTMWVMVPLIFAAISWLTLASASSGKSILRKEIDLGELPQGGAKQQEFRLLNDSTTTLVVDAFDISCPCAAIELTRKVAAPTEELSGKIILDMRLEPRFSGDLAIEPCGKSQQGDVVIILRIKARAITGRE